MLFDYKSLYKNYTDAELVAIVQHPGKYQPEAVEAAALLAKEQELNTERKEQDLSGENIGPVEEDMDGQSTNARVKKWLDKKTDFLLTGNNTPSQLFTPYASDEGEKSEIFDDLPNTLLLNRHINAIKKFSVIIGALVVFDLFLYLFRILGYLQYYIHDPYTTIGSLFDYAMLITGLVLLFRFKKAGWILVVALAVFRVVSALVLLKYFSITFKTILSIGLSSYALIFLLQPIKRSIFRITNVNMGWTIAVSFVVCALPHDG